MKACKYEEIEEIPAGALPVSVYAKKVGYANSNSVNIRYDRWLQNPEKGTKPPYEIKRWNGSNIVIPIKN